MYSALPPCGGSIQCIINADRKQENPPRKWRIFCFYSFLLIQQLIHHRVHLRLSGGVGRRAEGDAFGQAGAGLAVLGVLVALSGAAALYKTR